VHGYTPKTEKSCRKSFGARSQGALQRELARSSLFSLLRGASRPHRAEAENHHLLDGLHVSLHGVPQLATSRSMKTCWQMVNFRRIFVVA
jgi:hypothetical protein